MDLQAALKQLNSEDEGHWTTDGLPRVDVVQGITGNADLTRQAITEAAPGFTRTVARKSMMTEPVVTEDEVEDMEDPKAELAANSRELADALPQVEPLQEGESLLDRPIHEALRDEELCEATLREIEKLAAQLLKEKKVIEGKITKLYGQSDLLSRALTRMQAVDPDRTTSDIKKYLASSRKSREKRAAKTQAFLRSGVSPAEVLDALDPRAKVDRAYGQRKNPQMVRPTAPSPTLPRTEE